MHVRGLRCVSCGWSTKERLVYRCERCGGPLEIIYDYEEIAGRVSWNLLRRRHFNHWRYQEFFPIAKKAAVISLDEGGTHLIRSARIGPALGFKNIFFKCENLNHTGSFKDRGSTIEISKAREFGAATVVCATTGNMGASVAAYCAAANLEAKIFVPRTVAKLKLKQIQTYGAEIVKVRGDYTAAKNLAEAAFKSGGGATYLAGDYPYRGEGEKSIAFEIADELGETGGDHIRTAADVIIAPIGNGTLVSSIWKGYKEMNLANLAGHAPQLIGVQAAGCAPVIKAFISDGTIKPVTRPETIAEAIACGDPLDGEKALTALRESQGSGAIVSDSEIKVARTLLARKEGVLAEYAAAAALAGFLKFSSMLSKEQNIIVLVTGTGLKDLD